MPRAIRVLRADEPRAPVIDTLILTSEARRSGRAHVVGTRGTSVDLDLQLNTALLTDDMLMLDTGELVEVVAAIEPLVEVRAELSTLARIAWALGDRHVPVQIFSNRIRFQRDPTLEALVTALGGKVTPIDAPFEPEGGAYAVTHDAHHAHHHDHDHRHHGHHDHDHLHK